MKTALITGITGMDGSHLADLLVAKGYKVHGIKRHLAVDDTQNIHHLLKEDKIDLHWGDVTDFGSLLEIIKKTEPDEIYNLAAQSHAGASFSMNKYTADVCYMGVVNLLEIIRLINPKIKFFQASTSESLDPSAPLPWNEDTPRINISNPYGIAKEAARLEVERARKSYGLFAVNGIMFNHESERRAETFVTRKITKAAARIKLGKQKNLLLGNIEAKRDWGYAPEYMEAAVLMLQQEKPEDYVLATGESHSVREWLEASFEAVGLNAYDYYQPDERFMRPSDIPEIKGDTSKIKRELGWEARTKFKDLIKIMVEADLKNEEDSRQ